MDIIEILSKDDVRITFGNNRWLCLSDKIFTVYERKAYAKRTKILIETDDFGYAINILFGRYTC
jgi:hypothetical protein